MGRQAGLVMQRRQVAGEGRTSPIDRDDPQRLIRLIDELRALDLERRRHPTSSARFRDLARRMEAKAREVFAEASAAPPSHALDPDMSEGPRGPH